MARPSSLQIYVPAELAERVRLAAAAHGLGVSEWLRSVVFRACEEEASGAEAQATLAKLHRHSLFALVGIDALLAGHPDHGLRERTHKAFARKCRQLGLASANEEGASDEA
jgi:hypothetical protein